MSAVVSSKDCFAGDETGLTKLVNFFESLEYRNIVVLVGAGISTSCGIPDFRTPGSGLYSNLQKYNLPQPEAVFDIDFFRKQPEAFYKLAKELYPGKAQPSITHYFIRLLHEHGKLFRCFTQNIDGLELRAGVPAERVVQAHGSFDTASCIECKRQADSEYVRKCIFADQIPRCDQKSCQGLVKPDIVFFGEDLPPQYYERQRDLKTADAVIVIGTSLKVKPFATMLNDVDPSVPKILINNELVGREYCSFLGGGDLFVRGHCDFVCAHVISELWWMQRSLVKILHKEEIRDNKTEEFTVDTVGEYRMILVVNQDLLKVMKQGKVSGQVGHCVSSIVRNLERKLRGLSSGDSFDSVSSVGLPLGSDKKVTCKNNSSSVILATEPEQKQSQISSKESSASNAKQIDKGVSDKVADDAANVIQSGKAVADDIPTVDQSDKGEDNVLDQINNLINYCRWIGSCEAKIVKKAPESVLRELLRDYPHCTHSVYDAGKTQIPTGSLTVVGFLPCRKDQVPDIVQRLSLL